METKAKTLAMDADRRRKTEEARLHAAQAPPPDLERCMACETGILDSRLGGMCGDQDCCVDGGP